MRVGINAHLLAFSGNYRQAGLSRHIYELLMRVPRCAPGDEFVAAVGNRPIPDAARDAAPPNLLFSGSLLPTERAPVRIAWEQAAMPLWARRERLDLVHCPVNVLPLLSRVPSVLTIHDLIFMRYPQGYKPAKRLYLTMMTRLSVRRARRVIAVSEATRADVLHYLKVKPGRVLTVYNGVGEEFIPIEDAKVAQFKREQGLTGRVLLFVGTLEPRKNVETAIRAFSLFANDPEMRDVTFAIGGSKGWYYDTIFAEAERTGLAAEGRVRFLGRVGEAELPLWYNVATAVVYPSRYEGFGLPALEAMRCGTPAITSTAEALREVVGDAGLLVDPNDVEGWASAMRTLLEDDTQARALGKRGRTRAARFNWDACARETLEVYRSVLGRATAKNRSRIHNPTTRSE
jgi:glycosyltransferase involved in cell wall biosynthesis